MDSYSFSFSGPSWSSPVRDFLSHMFDCCGAFSQHLAPTYRHDRCERSVQMRLYSLTKRKFVLVFLAFFFSFGVSVLIGIAGPPIIDTTTVVGSSPKVVSANSLKTGPYMLQSPPMSAFHQELWLVALIETDSKQGTTFEQEFNTGILIRGVNGDAQTLVKSDNPVLGQELHNRTRRLRCSQTCEPLIMMHLGFLDFSYYFLTIRFYGLQQTRFHIQNITFQFKSYNTYFTQMEIWIRFVFLVITFLTTCLFAHSLRKFSFRDWSIEQKWMSLLLPLLLLYNDPLFPLTFLVNSWLPGMLDGMFQASFLCALLLFWLCVYHGVRQTNRRFSRFYLPKVLLVGVLWIVAVMLASWEEYNELHDPTYYYRMDTANFWGVKIFFFVLGGLYIMYLVYLLVRAYAELRQMPYFDLRLKFLTALMIIVIGITMAIMVLRFGGGVFRDNFVAQLSTNYQNSAEFVAFYGLLNFYLFTMAFVYSPSSNALYESHFKDNPALSMLNDSDEEVHYSSDAEETSLTTLPRQQVSEEDNFR